MTVIFLLLTLSDGIITGMFVFYLIAALLGDGPLARLTKLLLGIASGLAYAAWCLHIWFGDSEMGMGLAFGIILAPIALFLLLLLIAYVVDGKK